MSKQHEGTYSEDEIAELRTRYPDQRVDAMVAEALAVSEEDLLGDDSEDEDSKVDYSSLKKDELTSLLADRGLDTSGTNAEQAARLEEDDAQKASEA